jgi:hypothetical protein
MSRPLVFLVVIANVIGSLGMIYLFITNAAEEYLFAALAILNGVALLFVLRVVARSNLTQRQKNLWTITAFVGLGLGQLLFLVRNQNVFQRGEW